MVTARVIYHYEDGAWWAESPDVPGWSAAGGTFAEVRQLAAEGIPWTIAEADVEFRHIVAPDLLPYFNSRTAGAVAHVSVGQVGRLTITTVGPHAGVPSEHTQASPA